jgi:hypothetical protein
MKRLEGPLDQVRNTVTYELPDGRWATFDVRAVERFGLDALLREYGVEMPTDRVPVFQYGRQIGTMPPGFDPAFARSNSFMYDIRPGDFVRDGKGWVVGRTMGASDVDCVVGFVRDPAPPTQS